MDLKLLDPADDDQLMFLLEALHPEYWDALDRDEEIVVDGEPVNPRLHVALHQAVARQILAGDPPEAWQTAQRLAGLGYDWHNIMHMIAAVVSDDVYRARAIVKTCGSRSFRRLRAGGPAPAARRAFR